MNEREGAAIRPLPVHINQSVNRHAHSQFLLRTAGVDVTGKIAHGKRSPILSAGEFTGTANRPPGLSGKAPSPARMITRIADEMPRPAACRVAKAIGWAYGRPECPFANFNRRAGHRAAIPEEAWMFPVLRGYKVYPGYALNCIRDCMPKWPVLWFREEV